MNRLRRICSLLSPVLLAIALPAMAAPTWLIATPDETASAGAPIMLDVVKPAAQTNWPPTIRLRLEFDGRTQEVELASAGTSIAAENARRRYRGILPAHLTGLVRVQLVEAESNRLALLVTASGPRDQAQTPLATATSPDMPSVAADEILPPADEPALSVNEPMYFVIGGNGGLTARFQLSFKYRIFDPDSRPVQWLPLLSLLHFGYTQTSLWDLWEDSAPFHDNSYRPSFFWQGVISGNKLMPDLLRAGYEHESNGKDDPDSRSINILFAQPVWRTSFADGRTLIIAPKLYSYLDKEDNPDIQRYRGYIDWNFRYGFEDGWMVSTQLRSGTAGHGSAQFDLSNPLRMPLFARAGGFLHFQLFTGYGENLLDYNLDRGLQARVGFSIVR